MNTKNILKQLAIVTLTSSLFACNDFLDKEPLTEISPEYYLNEESQLTAYADGLYTDILPSHVKNYTYGTFGDDDNTDNQAGMSYDNKYCPGQWKVPQSESDNWKFEQIYKCNYFIATVTPKYEAGAITGSIDNIKHYIGEVYFLRAYEYFKRYQMFGDFPIIKEPLPDEIGALTEASKRMPRSEVARFILSDLDTAIDLMATTPDSKHTRISKETALLLKSRVALFEGTWLKNFKGTAFVPNGEGWPGKDKDYNASYSFLSGSIDDEISFFLTESMNAAKQIADVAVSQLVDNTGLVQQDAAAPVNPYMNMFGDVDLSGYKEVLLWRQYSKGLGVTHNVVVAAQWGDQGVGLTRGMVEGFLMANGLPIYANNSGYQGDNTIANVRKDRDSRLNIFLKEPGQKNILFESADGDHAVPVEPVPDITNGNADKGYSTGYALRKGGSFYQNQCVNGSNYTGSITFRAAEALLNYMEASYEKTGTLDADARRYWTALRTRSHVDTDFEKTIAATDMAKEAKNDWGAYTGGQLVNPTLYNIRRERRCELMAEGLRFMDLCRWRAMDQMIATPYHIEGIHLWNTPMETWYTNLKADGSDDANVSSNSRSEYIRPYEKNTKSNVFDGYKWVMAHYLKPIMIQQFLITASDGVTISTSPIYQNPGWPTIADQGPTE